MGLGGLCICWLVLWLFVSILFMVSAILWLLGVSDGLQVVVAVVFGIWWKALLECGLFGGFDVVLIL